MIYKILSRPESSSSSPDVCSCKANLAPPTGPRSRAPSPARFSFPQAQRARLSGYIDDSGNYQEGANPDPSYGGTLQNPPDAVLGPIDPATGQYTSVYGAQPNTSTPLFPIANASPDLPAAAAKPAASGYGWLIIAAVAALAVFSVTDTSTTSTKGRRR